MHIELNSFFPKTSIQYPQAAEILNSIETRNSVSGLFGVADLYYVEHVRVPTHGRT
jgi:hypothetical protein